MHHIQFIFTCNPSYLTHQSYGVFEISLTNGTDVTRLAALLTAGPHFIALKESHTQKRN